MKLLNINERSGMLIIPDNKIHKIRCIINHWLMKETATKHQLQKLVGNLLHIHRCVKPARLFTNRILQTLREAPARGSVRLSESFLKVLTGLLNSLRFSMVLLKSTLGSPLPVSYMSIVA